MAITQIVIHIYQYQLCTQLVEYPPKTAMPELAKSLLTELDGKAGLYYTAWFKSDQLERVKEYFTNMGYSVSISKHDG